MAKLLHILVAVATLACLLDEALGRRMSLRAKRKKVLRQMLEREARLRNDTLMQRLLYEESSKYQKDAANKPKYPSDYGDLSHYTLPPHVERHDNDSVDVSEWVREIVTDLTTKPTKRPKTSTLKRNRTTSKYKKKLAQRSPTTADPEALERLRNSTTLSFFDLTPPELIEDTIFPFPVEDLDPNYYTYKSKAWTTTKPSTASTATTVDPYQASIFRYFRSSLFAVNVTEFDPTVNDYWFKCIICQDRYPSKRQLEVHQDFDHLDLFSPGRPMYPDSSRSDWMMESIESYNIPPWNYTYYLTRQTLARDPYGNAYTLAMGRHSTTPPLYMQYVWD